MAPAQVLPLQVASPQLWCDEQVKIASTSQQMLTVKIWAEMEGQAEQFVGVVVVPVSRVAAGAEGSEGGWYEIRGEKNDVIVGPEGMSKIELTFVHREAPPLTLKPKP